MFGEAGANALPSARDGRRRAGGRVRADPPSACHSFPESSHQRPPDDIPSCVATAGLPRNVRGGVAGMGSRLQRPRARAGRNIMEPSPQRQLRKGRLPRMVSWYDPRLLTRIRTVVSSVFGQYADQRLMQAVTDRCDDAELCSRYDYSNPAAPNPQHQVTLDDDGALWIDYVADVGDGFEPTYSAAYLLAQDSL